jgi:hypothetical protein
LLKRAGVIMIAKTNMNEFAAGVAGRNKHFGDARNPWDVNRWPGGSSSGTGVSIAAGLKVEQIYDPSIRHYGLHNRDVCVASPHLDKHVRNCEIPILYCFGFSQGQGVSAFFFQRGL